MEALHYCLALRGGCCCSANTVLPIVGGAICGFFFFCFFFFFFFVLHIRLRGGRMASWFGRRPQGVCELRTVAEAQ